MRPGRLQLAALAVTALALTGCSSPADPPALVDVAGQGRGALHGTDISDVVVRPALVLTDTAGATFDLRARPAGTVTALFFGYTSCPDVCPTTMADLAAARRALPEAVRDRFEVAFVTEDPTHDTAPVVRRWLDRVDPTFIGLTGGGTRTAAVLAQLKAPASEVVSAAARPHDDTDLPDHQHQPGERSVEHTGSVYLFSGSRVLVYTGGTTPAEYAGDVEELLAA